MMLEDGLTKYLEQRLFYLSLQLRTMILAAKINQFKNLPSFSPHRSLIYHQISPLFLYSIYHMLLFKRSLIFQEIGK